MVQVSGGREGGVQRHVHNGFGVHVSHLGLEPFDRVHRPVGLVEGHVDDRGRAPSGCGARRRRDAFIHTRASVDVCVYESRKNQVAAGIKRFRTLQRGLIDLDDPPARNRHPAVTHDRSVWPDDITADHEVGNTCVAHRWDLTSSSSCRASRARCPRSKTGIVIRAAISLSASDEKPT